MGIILLIFITILTILSGIISSKGDLYTRRDSKFSLTENGKWVTILGLAIIGLSVAQLLLSNNENEEREKTLRGDYAKSVEEITANHNLRANELRHNYDSSSTALKKAYDTSTKDIVKALAAYGLEYVASEKRIKKLLTNSITSKPDPVFGIDEIKIVQVNGALTKFRLDFISSDAGSTEHNISVHTIASKNLSGPYKYFGIGSKLEKTTIATNGHLMPYIEFGNIKEDDLLFFYIVGTYQNISKSKKFSVSEVVGFNMKNKNKFLVIGETAEAIKRVCVDKK